MKKVPDFIRESLKDIQSKISNKNYDLASDIAHDTIIVSAKLDYPHELFMFEILESVCDQLQDTKSYNIPNQESKELCDDVVKHIQLLYDAYEHNQSNVYKILEKIRYLTTTYQFRAYAYPQIKPNLFKSPPR